MVRTWQDNASRGHFSDELAFGVSAQGNKGSYITERGQTLILIGKQDRDHRSSFGMQTGQELSAHAFSIHNDPLDLGTCLLLFIACDNGGESRRQMPDPLDGLSPAVDSPGRHEARPVLGSPGSH